MSDDLSQSKINAAVDAMNGGRQDFAGMPPIATVARGLINDQGRVVVDVTSCETPAEVLAALGGVSESDADQPGGYLQLDEDGNIVGKIVLADASGVSLGVNELGVNGVGELIIGTTTGKQLVFDKTDAMIDAHGAASSSIDIPDNAVKMLTVKESTFSASAKSTTGYVRGMNWDGTLTANAGIGNPATDTPITWLTAASPYTARIPKLVAVWSTDSSGNPSGELTSLTCNGNKLTAVSVKNALSLTALNVASNQLTTLDVSKNVALTSLTCGENFLPVLFVSENTSLTLLMCSVNRLSSLDISRNLLLTILDCSGNSLSLLDVSENTALIDIKCGTNQLSTLDVTANTLLQTLSCNGNPLTALNLSNNTSMELLEASSCELATLTIPVALWHENDGVVCSGNPITSTKALLDAWFATLPTISEGGSIYVGAAALALDPAPDTSIATGKGWTVEGDF